MRGGRPGLIGTVARTAVVAGTATATSHAVNRRIQQRELAKGAQSQEMAPVEEQAPPAPTPAPVGMTQEQKMAQLKQLAELKQMGALTEEEFQQEKQKILAQ